MKIALVAIGYNRIHDYSRLIESLKKANYLCDTVDLIMSIDNSGKNDVIDMANKVIWPFGNSIVRTFKERQGLKKHILKCGEYLNEYDALVILEDDVIVSPEFYNYTRQAVNQYRNNDNIAGISLYNHLFNVFCQYPFIPENCDKDAYFMQLAQSWGQVWMKRQWFDFIKWYNENSVFEMNDRIPNPISSWGDNSWLKYHIKYCIETNKYFVYPYKSLTTCFSTVGQHSKYTKDTYQVPMNNYMISEYKFPLYMDESSIYYDAFFERKFNLSQNLGINEMDLCVDLYGIKTNKEQYKYVLSSCSLPYTIIKSFGRHMRPHESNILYNIQGNDIFLYDMHEKKSIDKTYKNKRINQFIYYYRTYDKVIDMIRTSIFMTINKLFKK